VSGDKQPKIHQITSKQGDKPDQDPTEAPRKTFLVAVPSGEGYISIGIEGTVFEVDRNGNLNIYNGQRQAANFSHGNWCWIQRDL
jgi:hypothetical protein